MLQTPENNSS